MLRRLALALMLLTVPAWANYEFLGNVLEQQLLVDGADLTVTSGHVLHLRFVRDDILRVWLTRADHDVAPLAGIVQLPAQGVTAKHSVVEGGILLASRKLRVIVQLLPCRITIADANGNLLQNDDSGFGIGWDGSEVRCWKEIGADERFYGLGLKTGELDKRGREWTMWNSDIPGYTRDTDPLYESIPFYVGLREGRAYGVYFNNSFRSRFNLGAGNHRYLSFAADDGVMDYFFVAGPGFAEVLSGYTDLTGHMPMPPLWALGYQQCRWSYYPDSEVLNLARTFREKRIPADVIYLDIHHMDGYRVFTWHPEWFARPKPMLQALDQSGFKVVTIVDPGVKADSNYSVAREGLARNHFVRYPDGEVYTGDVWPGRSYFPDFSREATREWWGGLAGQWRDQGVRGFWNDMNEPAVWGQAFPLETMFDDDGLRASHKRTHNRYGYLMAEATYAGLKKTHPNERPFILTRAAFAGIQRYSAVWTGDNVSSEEHLELGIRMMLGEGMSGVPFVGTDIGGFMGGSPSQELYARWMQIGALSPLSRTHAHHGKDAQEPWSFGEYVEDIARKYLTLRYRLMPYLYTAFHDASATGVPVWRPLFWNHQDDPRAFDWAYQHQFYWGDDVLVAPVTRVGTKLQRIYLPEGRWLEWETPRVYEGEQELVIDTPLERLPMFLREGGCVFMRDSVQFSDEHPIRELTTTIFPATRPDTSELYEDDGISFSSADGDYRTTAYASWCSDAVVSVQRILHHDQYRPQPRRLVLILKDLATAPAEVLVNGQPMTNYLFSADRHELTVRWPSEFEFDSLTVRR
ncbi:DUF4968 domain-containing protein [candidate division KSB1 bacterium]|nr:DUF4968 domain-containing protein [candidate division KSB1 bacterium]